MTLFLVEFILMKIFQIPWRKMLQLLLESLCLKEVYYLSLSKSSIWNKMNLFCQLSLTAGPSEKHRICICLSLSEIYSGEPQNWDLSNKLAVTVNESKSPLLF